MARAAAFLILLSIAVPPAAGAPPDTPRAMTLEARRLMESGDVSGALTLMVSARRALTSVQPADRELADALAGQLHNAAVRLNNGGDAPRAMAAFGEALALDLDLKGVRDAAFRERLRASILQVGRFLAASGRGAAALDVCRLLASRDPSNAEAHTVLGEVQLSLGDNARAAQSFEEAAGADAASAAAAAGAGQAWLGQAESAAKEGRTADGARMAEVAARWLERAAELDPGRAPRLTALARARSRLSALQLRMGEAAESARTAQEASVSLRRAVDLDPAAPWPRLDLAMFLFSSEAYLDAAGQFGAVERRLDTLLAADPAGRDAPSWRSARETARDNQAACWHNLAVDALNSARFDEAGGLLSRLCAQGDRWQRPCRSLRATLDRRRETFGRAVAEQERQLAQDPERASALLVLGDLYAQVGDFDRAKGYYERLRAGGGASAGLADRLAAVTDPGTLPEIVKVVEAPGGRVRLTFYAPSLEADLVTAVKASWLRVTTALGNDSLGNDLSVVIYPTQRAFRERAGARVGGLVKGFYLHGRVSLFQTPSHAVVEWVSTLTHEMTHHAVERMSGGLAPRWLSEGVARYVEGETAVLDRDRLRGRAEAGALPALADLDEVLLRSWNDPEAFLDARDLSLRAVEELAHRLGGDAGLRGALHRLAVAPGEGKGAVESALGITLSGLDAAWRQRDLKGP